MNILDKLWTRNGARIIAGAGSFILTGVVLAMIYTRPDIAENDLFKTIAQAIVIQGLIGLVMAFLFTGATRKTDEGEGQ